MSQKSLPNDLTTLQVEEEKVDNFNRAGEARIIWLEYRCRKRSMLRKRFYRKIKTKFNLDLTKKKKVIDAAVIDLKRELEAKSDQIKALQKKRSR